MFDNYQEAIEYYENKLEEKLEDKYYDSPIGELLNLHVESSEFYNLSTIELKKIIVKLQEQLKYMYQDLYRIENGDYIDSIKESWDKNANEIQTENPDWDKYLNSEAYDNEVQFIQQIEWDDFKTNYEEEIKCINSNSSILYDIVSISKELPNITKEILEYKKETMYDTIEECFND